MKNLIHMINLKKKYKQKSILIKKNKKNLILVKFLIKINLINFAKIWKKNINLIINTNIKINFKVCKNNTFIKLKNLKKNFLKKNIILSSNKGLMSNTQAINKRLGGLICFFILI